jgi:hypothetical protein
MTIFKGSVLLKSDHPDLAEKRIASPRVARLHGQAQARADRQLHVAVANLWPLDR